MTDHASRLQPARRQLLILALAAVALYVIVPQLGSFKHSLSALSNAEWAAVVPAVGCVAVSYVAAAASYCLLAWRRLAYARTLLVQVAGMFVNRLLPAGIGGIGVNYLYLRKTGHSGTRAASVVTANNVVGIVGNLLLLLTVLAFYHESLPPLQLDRIGNPWLILGVVAAVGLTWLVLYRLYGERFNRKLRDFAHQLLDYRQRPGRTLAALGCAIGLALANVLALSFCLLAMGVSLPLVSVLLIFNLGVLLGTATPTPGGLGGVEAGLVGGLVIYHVDSATALAAVLLFRFISYWLPLAVGGIAFIYTQKKGYL